MTAPSRVDLADPFLCIMRSFLGAEAVESYLEWHRVIEFHERRGAVPDD